MTPNALPADERANRAARYQPRGRGAWLMSQARRTAAALSLWQVQRAAAKLGF